MEASLQVVDACDQTVVEEIDESDEANECVVDDALNERIPINLPFCDRTVWLRWVPALLGFFGISGSALVLCTAASVVANATAYVKDAKTHDPIANVIFKRDDDKEFETTSDHTGQFRPNAELSAEPTVFLSRLVGKYKLTAESDDYETLSATFSPLDFIVGTRTIYLNPKSGPSALNKAGIAPAAAESEPIDVPGLLQEIQETFNKEGFELTRLYGPTGAQNQSAYVVSDDAETAIAAKLETILPLLQTDPHVMRVFLDNSRNESVAIGLYHLWDGTGEEMRRKISFFMFECLLNMQARYRCKDTVEGWQKSREFRKRAYFHVLNEYPSWFEGKDAKCACALGVTFCDFMISPQAAPVDEGEKKRTTAERNAAAMKQRVRLYTTVLDGLNYALSAKKLPINCEEVKWAKRKLVEISNRADAKSLFNDVSVKRAWTDFLKHKIPPCMVEPPCHCLKPRTIE